MTIDIYMCAEEMCDGRFANSGQSISCSEPVGSSISIQTVAFLTRIVLDRC